VEQLQNALIDKDKTGEWCYKFAEFVSETNVELLQDALITKDETGKWCFLFAMNVKKQM